MINTKITTALACAVMMTGCVTPYSEAPVAKNFPTTSQEKLQAASHWGIITADLSKKIKASIAGKIDQQQPIYVSSKDVSPFNRAVVGEIISSLVADGYSVVKTADTPVRVNVETQVLQFTANRPQAKRVGIFTALAVGAWAYEPLSATAGGAATALIAAADAATYFNSDNASGATPQTEIIIDVSVTDANRYVAVSRGTYYVADTDRGLYQAAQIAQTKDFGVRGTK